MGSTSSGELLDIFLGARVPHTLQFAGQNPTSLSPVCVTFNRDEKGAPAASWVEWVYWVALALVDQGIISKRLSRYGEGPVRCDSAISAVPMAADTMAADTMVVVCRRRIG
jgi:hypothetical protein